MTKGTLFEVPIALGGICGLRRGEILGLQEVDIDFERHRIKISHQLVEVKKELLFTAPKSQDSNRTITRALGDIGKIDSKNFRRD